jgi:hypothetical protein
LSVTGTNVTTVAADAVVAFMKATPRIKRCTNRR